MKKKITLILLSIICTFSMGLGVFSAMQKSVKAEEIGFSDSVYYQATKPINVNLNTFEATVNIVKNSGRQIIASNYSGNDQSDQFDFEIHSENDPLTGKIYYGRPRIFYSYWHPGGGSTDTFKDPQYHSTEAVFGKYADNGDAVDITGAGDVKVVITVERINGKVGQARCWINGREALEISSVGAEGLNENLYNAQVPNNTMLLIGNDYRRSSTIANSNNVIKNVTLYSIKKSEDNIPSSPTDFISSGTGVVCAYNLQGQGGAKNIKDLSGNGYDLKLADHTVYNTNTSNGVTFANKDVYYKTLNVINTPINTVEANITVPEGGCGRGVIWGNFDSTSDFNFETHPTGGVRLYFQNANLIDIVLGGNVNNTGKLNTPGTYHIALTIDRNSKTISYYLNGVLEDSVSPSTEKIYKGSAGGYSDDTTNQKKFLSSLSNLNLNNQATFGVGNDNRTSSRDGSRLKVTLNSLAVFSSKRVVYSNVNQVNGDMTSIATTAQGLIALYNFNGKQGNRVIRDLSNNGNHLVLYDMNSTASNITFANEEIYNATNKLTQAQNTFEAWVNVPTTIANATRVGTIVGNYCDINGETPDAVSFEIHKYGKPRIYFRHDGNVSIKDVIFPYDMRTGIDTHVAITVDRANQTATLYINGEIPLDCYNLPLTKDTGSTQNTLASTQICNSYPLAVGNDYRVDKGNSRFKGTIYSVAVYSDVRTQAEVRADLENITVDSSLLLAYDLVGKSGQTPIEDLSNNNNDLVLGNGLHNVWAADNYFMQDKALVTLPRTVEVVVKIPTTSTGRSGMIFGNYGQSGVKDCFCIEVHNYGYPRVYIKDNNGKISDITFKTNVATGEWVHLAYVIDGNSAYLYINGVKYAGEVLSKNILNAETSVTGDSTTENGIGSLATGTNTNIDFTNGLMVGGDLRANNEQYFKGLIRTIVGYSDVRTQAEITTYYNNYTSASRVYDVSNANLMFAYNMHNQMGAEVVQDKTSNDIDLLCATSYGKAVEVKTEVASLTEEVSASTKTAITTANTNYNALTTAEKKYVTNYTGTKLADRVETLADNESKANAVTSSISALSQDATLSDENAIINARVAYDNLTTDQKTFVTNLALLESAESNLATNKTTAQVVVDTINLLPSTRGKNDENAIVNAVTLYNGLTNAQKTFVTNYSVLQEAETTLNNNKAVAQVVQNKIDALPAVVSINHQAQITDARVAYDNLTADQKTFVTNLSTLELKEETWANLINTFGMEIGAGFRSYWSTPNCGITFGAKVEATGADFSNVYLFIAPYDFVQTVKNSTNNQVITYLNNGDYVNAFDAYLEISNNVAYTLVKPAVIEDNGVTHFRGGIKNIKDANLSRKMFGIYYFDLGGGKYKYATMSLGETEQARSMAYVASAFYNSGKTLSKNDEYMSSFWMEKAVKTAVSKSDKNIDVSTIRYFDSENGTKNTTIISAQTSGTLFDDVLTLSQVKLNVNGKEVTVNQRLNFAVRYGNDLSSYVTNGGTTASSVYVNTKKSTADNANGYVNGTVYMGTGDTISGANFKLQLAKYDLAKARLTSGNVNFTDTIKSDNENLVDTYKNSIITPSNDIKLNVPTGGNVLWAKTISYSEITNLGDVVFTSTKTESGWEDNGGNGSLTNANTQIKLNLTTTLSGGSFIGSVFGSSIATKNSFDLTIDYTYSDSYNSDGEVAKTAQSNKYYYGQTYNYVETEIDGYTAYLDQNRQTQATTGTISGNVDTTVYYMPNENDITINYSVATEPSKTITVKTDYPYRVNTPAILGYVTDTAYVSGTAPAGGKTVTVQYLEVSHTSDSGVYFDGFDTIQAKFANIGVGDAEHGGTANGSKASEYVDFYGGYTKTVLDSDMLFLFNDYSTTTNYVKADTIYFEFEFKVNQVASTEQWSKLGIVLDSGRIDANERPVKRDMLYIDIGGAYNVDANGNPVSNNATNYRAPTKNVGLYHYYGKKKDAEGKVVNDESYNEPAEVKNLACLPDYTKEFVKLSIYKYNENNLGHVLFAINDNLVYSYSNADLCCPVFTGILAYNSLYTIQNAKYRLSGGTNGKTVSNANTSFKQYSNTVGHTDFYFETTLTANETVTSDNWTKLGILVRSTEDYKDELYFYWDLPGAVNPTSDKRRVGLATCIDGTYHWWEKRDEIGIENWRGGEKLAYVREDASNDPIKVTKADGSVVGGENKFSVLKRGNKLVFMVNGIPYIVKTDDMFKGECIVGILSLSINFTFSNSFCIVNSSKLEQIAKERMIYNDDVVIDGNFDDTAWQNAGKIVEREANNGEYTRFQAFLGSTFVYVRAELGTFNYQNGIRNFKEESDGNSMVPVLDSEGKRIPTIGYHLYTNTNIEVVARFEVNGQSTSNQVIASSILNSTNCADFAFKVEEGVQLKTGTGFKISVEMAIPYSSWGGAKQGVTELIVQFAARPGYDKNGEELKETDYTNNELGGYWWTDYVNYTITSSGIK